MIRLLSLIVVYSIVFFGQIKTLADTQEIISSHNEFGGKTIEINKEDFSITRNYHDDEDNIVKEEIIFTVDYQIDNNLRKIIVYYHFGKKIMEESIFSDVFSDRTLIEKSIVHFDRNTGERVMEENHLVPPFSSYNIIFREKGKKKKIEWHYPENIDGIEKNIVFFDDNEIAVKTESYYTEKTIREQGHYKRIYFTALNKNRYVRKYRQEWFYTEEFSKKNNGIAKKIEYFHYSTGRPVEIKTAYFDRNDQFLSQ
ncbi:hypothetical protein KJ966_26325 [bacterium]|nr:hypothetical protein [bacterium]